MLVAASALGGTGLVGPVGASAADKPPQPPPPAKATVGNRNSKFATEKHNTVILVSDVKAVVPGGEAPDARGSGSRGAQGLCPGPAYVSADLAIPGGSATFDFPAMLSDVDIARMRVSSLEADGFFIRYCPTGDGTWRLDRVFRFNPGPGAPEPVAVVPPEVVAQLALAQITPPVPRPATAPAIGLSTIVGISTWTWVDPGQWHPLTASARVGGTGVSATVTPVKVTWDMGEGHDKSVAVCEGPGEVYRLDVPDELQHTSCAYVYQWASADHRHDDHPGDVYHATATITWSVAWRDTGVGGRSGTLADLHTSAGFDVRVKEVQAVVCYDTPLGECDAPSG